jgi:hypothetical protein
MTKAQSERVRLEASKAWLDRAGLVPPKAMEESRDPEKPLHEMTVTEMRAYRDRLEAEIVGRAKDVTPTPDPADEVLGE